MRTTFLSLPLLIWLALLVMMLVRFAIMFGTGPLHDEAYYWSWSQELDFGYYDQPFLTGWLLAPFVALLGDGAWVMRAVATLLIFAATAFLALTVNALSGPPKAQNAQQVLQGQKGRSGVEGSGSAALSGFILLAFTSPVLWSVGLFYVHDTVMVCFLSLGLWLGVEALKRDKGLSSRPWWIMAGLALALAFSAKVSAALWIMALGLSVAVHPQSRPHLRAAGPWLGAGLPLAAFLLFLTWNALNGWVTFRHVGGEHLVPDTSTPASDRFLRFGLVVLATLLFSGLTAIVLVVLGAVRRFRALLHNPGVFALVVFALLPLLIFFGLSGLRDVYLNWLIPSCLGLLVLSCCLWIGPIRRWHVITSLPSAMLALALLLPIAFRQPWFMPSNARDMLGWEASIEKLIEYRDVAYPGYEIAGNYYHLAAQTSFHQGTVRPSVGLDPRPHQFNLYHWPDDKARAPLLVLTPSLEEGMEALSGVFCSVTPLSPWPVNHREGRIALPYLFAIHNPSEKPDCG